MVSMLSAATGVPMRNDIVMTGEITLRGLILPVGGIKEKVLAAHRYGIERVIIPSENKSDLAGIPEKIRKKCEFICVDSIDDVVKNVFTRKPKRQRTAARKKAVRKR